MDITSVSGLLAGTMFPISVMPGYLQVIAKCLPLTHALEAMRQSLLIGLSIREMSGSLISLSVFVVIMVPLTYLVNRFCMNKARRTGALASH